MASEIKLPELGENVEEGEVVEVKVSAGDEVREGQALLEVEAEKSTVEVPSPQAGRITQVLVKKGDRVRAGQSLCLIDGGDGKPAKEAPADKKDKKAAPAPKGKKEQEEEPEKEIEEKPARVQKTEREKPEEEKEPEEEKAEEPAPTPKEEEPEETGKEKEKPQGIETGNGRKVPPPPPAEKKVVPAGPATRRLARELGVDLTQVTGTAPAGRVTPDDVKTYVRQLASGGGVRQATRGPALPNFEQWGPVERLPLDAIRRKTGEQMSLSWSLVPHVTQHDLADITEIEAFRKQQEGKGPKLTVTAFALKAAAIVLRQFPHFNSSLDPANNQLILKHYIHIGVAVDTERGLLVPVLRDVDKKSVHDLAGELAELAERTRQKKIVADDLKGGTFTISNLGGIGGTGFSPIVNYPEVAILGLSRARLQPVAREGKFVARLLLPLSLSYDHRVIDGAAAARFTRRFAELLESPMMMLVHA